MLDKFNFAIIWLTENRRSELLALARKKSGSAGGPKDWLTKEEWQGLSPRDQKVLLRLADWHRLVHRAIHFRYGRWPLRWHFGQVWHLAYLILELAHDF